MVSRTMTFPAGRSLLTLSYRARAHAANGGRNDRSYDADVTDAEATAYVAEVGEGNEQLLQQPWLEAVRERYEGKILLLLLNICRRY